jgi:hypothetical protein
LGSTPLEEIIAREISSARIALEREESLANVLRRLGFTEGLTWPNVVRAMRAAGFSIYEFEKLSINHVIEILEARAKALDYLRELCERYQPGDHLPIEWGDDLIGTQWTSPSLRKDALMAGGRPVETAATIDGKKLRELRGDTPQPVFARLCGISVDTLRRAERGNASPTTIKKIERYRNLKRSTGPDIKLKKS